MSRQHGCNGEESSYYEYTTEWVRIVNRARLFELNDTAYWLVREIKPCSRDRRHAMLKSSSVEPDQKVYLVTKQSKSLRKTLKRGAASKSPTEK